MAANKQLNLWMASNTAERNSLGSGGGLRVGDFCLVSGLNLYVAITVAAASSTWRAIAGVPTTGPMALGGKNTADTLARSVFDNSSVSFRAVLDTSPTTVSFAPTATSNWPLTPSLVTWNATGFTFAGSSNGLVANGTAYWRGTYTVLY